MKAGTDPHQDYPQTAKIRNQGRHALVRRRGAAAICDMGLSTFDRADERARLLRRLLRLASRLQLHLITADQLPTPSLARKEGHDVA